MRSPDQYDDDDDEHDDLANPAVEDAHDQTTFAFARSAAIAAAIATESAFGAGVNVTFLESMNDAFPLIVTW